MDLGDECRGSRTSVCRALGWGGVPVAGLVEEEVLGTLEQGTNPKCSEHFSRTSYSLLNDCMCMCSLYVCTKQCKSGTTPPFGGLINYASELHCMLEIWNMFKKRCRFDMRAWGSTNCTSLLLQGKEQMSFNCTQMLQPLLPVRNFPC